MSVDPGRPQACPKCGGTAIASIAYGFPGAEMREAAERGEIALGGCSIDERVRRWECHGCKATFNDGGADLLEPIP